MGTSGESDVARSKAKLLK